MTTSTTKAILDTNVLVSGPLGSTLSRDIDSRMQHTLLESFIAHAEFTVPSDEVNLCRDRKDNIFLSAAASGRVN